MQHLTRYLGIEHSVICVIGATCVHARNMSSSSWVVIACRGSTACIRRSHGC